MASYFYTSQKPDLNDSQSFSCPERKRVIKCAITPVLPSLYGTVDSNLDAASEESLVMSNSAHPSGSQES